jgi:hexosaminidase
MFKGESTLVALERKWQLQNRRWIAFYKNDMDMTIDLQQPTEISSVAISTCVEKGDWVFDARGLSVEVRTMARTLPKCFRGVSCYERNDKNGIYEHKCHSAGENSIRESGCLV